MLGTARKDFGQNDSIEEKRMRLKYRVSFFFLNSALLLTTVNVLKIHQHLPQACFLIFFFSAGHKQLLRRVHILHTLHHLTVQYTAYLSKLEKNMAVLTDRTLLLSSTFSYMKYILSHRSDAFFHHLSSSFYTISYTIK